MAQEAVSPMQTNRKPEKGIECRHAVHCRSRDGGRCNCSPSYRGHVWCARDQKQLRGPWSPTPTQARNWRQDALVAVRKGSLRAPVALTVSEVAHDFIVGAREGRILDRAGKRYKPSSIRNYD